MRIWWKSFQSPMALSTQGMAVAPRVIPRPHDRDPITVRRWGETYSKAESKYVVIVITFLKPLEQYVYLEQKCCCRKWAG